MNNQQVGILTTSLVVLYLLLRKPKNTANITEEPTVITAPVVGSFLYPIVPQISIRTQDAWGHGAYAASRDGGSRKHAGIDIVTVPGQLIQSPVDGVVDRISKPSSVAGRTYLSGLRIIGTGVYSGWTVTMWYFLPYMAASIRGVTIYKGQVLGTAQSLSEGYDDQMTNHVHLQIETDAGNFVDPTSLL